MRKIGNSRRRRILAGFAGASHREHGLLRSRFLKLEAGDSAGARSCLTLRQVLEGLTDAFVIALPVILAAEIFVEESSQRPQVFSTVLTTHLRFALPWRGFHYIGKFSQLKTFS